LLERHNDFGVQLHKYLFCKGVDVLLTNEHMFCSPKKDIS